ncbi:MULTISPECIES: RluA family pseudouridine synthase [Nostoc]|uniref:RNA pseudouridylate synthase n=1 Tax=Nostoc paludosum FACHB-159 TaxID=2692908 RepID=A0ABR8KDF0_9NOSO|nr:MULTISPECIES: RluA family pseudouridine synthase [Nostoc]MBD2681093.1 RluA family pseudouridine synthase [Nostoc sp. FACHB-857]MBD2737570.1 RluA family pseudouridine synthase [Nostoc paludosum FACHB-159]
MVILHPVSDFIDCDFSVSDSWPSYYYQGFCPRSGDCLILPRTPLSEAIAQGLMQHLAKDNYYSREGKMYGILLVELPNGEQRVLKAFSGLLHGCSVVEGWVPPIPGRDEVAFQEARTLAELDAIKEEILTLKQLNERQQYEKLSGEFEQQLQAISDRHAHCKHQRQQKRQQICNTLAGEALTIALEQLDTESRQQKIERRQLKRRQNAVLQPLQQLIAAADERIRELKQQRKELSRQLQAQMHASYSLTNFAGRSQSLQQLMPEGSPTGTGDCCAPKLLHYAATHHLKPLAMAEFWWGASSVNQDKIQGEFYGACAERCQPLMGFLLSGLQMEDAGTENMKAWGNGMSSSFTASPRLPLSASSSVPIIYEDEWLMAVDKPPGLLSVPGRYRDRQDSVFSRLCNMLPDGMTLASVHRLDQETSGILLLARDRQTHRQLSQQFQQRQVRKVYEALLAGFVEVEQGTIELPLWGDPENRPYQQVDWQRGKPSLTQFQVMGREGDYTRVEFTPLTGRTHQLRVHAADVRGLGVTILGDRLYGCRANVNRLHLHARELSFKHPQLGQMHLEVETPF